MHRDDVQNIPPADFDMDEDGDDVHAHHIRMTQPSQQPPPPPADIDMNESGDDVYARRMRMSQAQQQASAEDVPPPPPPMIPPEPTNPAHTAPLKPRNILERIQAGASISKAPVLFELPPAPADIPSSEAELAEALEREAEADADVEAEGTPPPPGSNDDDEPAPRSNRPGQKGFAERLMAKYGYTKGSGLGAQGQGITSALKVKVEKRKKRSDAEGGGYLTPGGKGTIVGGKKSASAAQMEEGKFGAMSEVVVLKGMLAGIADVGEEMGNGLLDDIGGECDKKYGRVERVFVWRDHGDDEESPPVFVKFTAQLSALRVSLTPFTERAI